MAVGRHLEFLEILTADELRRSQMHHIAKFHQNRSSDCEDITIYPIFQDGGRRRIGCVFHVAGPPRRIFGGLYCYAKFGWNPCSGFHDINV